MKKHSKKSLALVFKSEIANILRDHEKRLVAHIKLMYDRDAFEEISFMLDDQLSGLDNIFTELTRDLLEQ